MLGLAPTPLAIAPDSASVSRAPSALEITDARCYRAPPPGGLLAAWSDAEVFPQAGSNMTRVATVPAGPADVARASQALERAVACAEQGISDVAAVLVSAEDLRELPRPELRRALDRILMAPQADEGLESLRDTGVLDALLPEVSALVGFGDGEWRHKDVWKHTKQVVCQSVARLEIRWAALFHDIGKVHTRSVTPDGEVHFFGHAELGARMFDKIGRRTALFASDAALGAAVRFLVLHHLRASQYDGKWTDSAVRRFARDMGAQLDDLLSLSRADITTKRPEKKRRGIALIDELGERITILAASDAVVPPLPSGVGNAIMEAFGLPPSRRIGDIKRALEAAIESGEIDSHEEAGYYVRFVAEHRDRFELG
jgi:poly(A) polymerase